MFRSELTGETSGPHPWPDLAHKHTGGSTGAESLHSRNMFILTDPERETQHRLSDSSGGAGPGSATGAKTRPTNLSGVGARWGRRTARRLPERRVVNGG